MSSMPRRFTLMMPVPPANENKTIQNLLETLGDRVELHPIYQRDIKWNAEAMGELVRSIMSAGFVPSILLYKLQPGDERRHPSYKTEVVDGQHRLFTIYHYFHSKQVELPGKKPFLISLPYKNEDKTITYLFYKETAETVAWQAESGKKVEYMTEEEKDTFNSFDLNVREIRSPLSLDQRRNLFLTLQKGVPVRGSDLYKNKTDVPLVRFISETKRWETRMKAAMLGHCIVYAQQYWLNWVIRFFLIQNASDLDERATAFMVSDSRINQMIKKGCVELNSTPESEAALDMAVTRFFSFIDILKPGVKLTPTQFFASFTHLLDAQEGRESLLETHMKEWSTWGMTVKQRKMWENRGFDDAERQDCFERAVDELESISVPAPEPEARKNIPKAIRDAVWAAAFGDALIGNCFCCKKVIDIELWDCAHIVAHKKGGKDEKKNLLPACRGCNRSMGTENLMDFKARCYPDA